MGLKKERRQELAKKWGFKDDELIDLLCEGEEDGDDDISELATNMGYIWSFRLSKWFDKNQGQLEKDQKDFDTLIEEIRSEKERN